MLKKLNSWLRLSRVFKYVVTVALGLLLSSLSALADQAAAPAAGGPAGAASTAPSMAGMLMPFLLMFGVIWLMILRPQQKRMRDQVNLLKTLKHGDEVLTSSGILGKITGITEKVVTLEVADNVRVKMLKSQVTQVVKGQIKEINA
jgi:preprotein translocase subunit YajC